MSDLRVRQRPAVSARSRPAALPPNLQRYADTGEALVAEPFRGITADGHVVPRLFSVEKTGVSTRPLREAAEAFLASLAPSSGHGPCSAWTRTGGAAGATSIRF